MIVILENIKVRNTSLYCLLLIILAIQSTSAQFTITEDFRGSGSPDIIIGDHAYLTSGIDDPAGAGWLRLTKARKDQKGYAYVNRSFPSTLGVIIDFEYTMWRDVADTYNGADGFTIFLFDATYGPGSFALGAYGGSLGYANSTASTPQTAGLTGGYIGIGFDAYGNYVRSSEGKNGGSVDVSPNSVVFRGPTTSDQPADPITNRYLGGVTLFPDGTSVDALAQAGNPSQNVIDYNTTTTTRPSQAIFYRRVQTEIVPTNDGRFEIIVRWAKEYGGEFVDLMSYITEDAPPALLKLGFAASTGGGFNNHEIRNLLISTPGNLRVYKSASKDILRSVPGAGEENEVTFNLEITNDTSTSLSEIEISDQLTDGNGDPIPSTMFRITDISADTNFLPGSVNLPNPTISSPITNGSFSGSVGLPANTTGIIKVTGYLNGEIPFGNLLNNTVEISNNEITDQDLENNTSTIGVPVVAEEVDMVIEKKVDDYCLDGTDGNTFTILVGNMGALDATYTTTSTIKVIETISQGVVNVPANSQWSVSNSGNTYTFTKTGSGTLSTGRTLPPITYTVTSTSSFSSISEVEFINSTTNVNLEPVENRLNNINEISINSQPSKPALANSIFYLCQGESSLSLEDYVEADPGHTLYWYNNLGGKPLLNIPVPNTSVTGSTTYYVSQSNGNCESELQEIEVVVLEKPTSGSITGGEEICVNSTPSQIGNDTPGTGDGTISYRWEYSEDNGATWEIVSGQSQDNYQPEAIQTNTQFRRITIANTSGILCESEPSNVVTFTTKNCMVITNPMLPSKAKR